MKKIFTLFALAFLFAFNGGNVAFAESEIVKSWTLTGLSADVAVTKNTSNALTVNRFQCELVTAPANCAGLYLQGDWKCYKKNNGLRNISRGDRLVVVPDLKAGDVITVTVNDVQYITSAKYVGATTGNTVTYTMEADGNFYFNFAKQTGSQWPAVQSISVSREIKENVCYAPTFKAVGASNEARTFNLTCETEGAEIYYSETELTKAEGGVKYTDNVTTSAAKIWAYAKTANATSEVVSFDTGAGSVLKLNAPAYAVSIAEKNGYLHPVYTLSSDQNDILGKPAVSYSYQLNGEEANGNSFMALKPGTAVVTVKADGYESSSTTIEIPATYYKKTKSYDFSTFESHSENAVASSYSVNNVGCQAYEIAADAIEDITLNSIHLLWKITANEAWGLFARTGKGTVTYNGAFPEGSIITYLDLLGAASSSTSNVLSFNQYGSLGSMNVYIPLSEEELEEIEKIENSFMAVEGPAYDPDKAPEGFVESPVHPENGMVEFPEDDNEEATESGAATGINGAEAGVKVVSIVTVNGAKVSSLQKGINIVTLSNGKRVKVLK